MIYLWVSGEGWKEFELTDTAEFEKRGITIGSGAEIGSWARIGSGAKPVIVYIIGSRHPVSYWGEDRIDIGCQRHTIAEWQKSYAEIGKENFYSDEALEEYRRYIDFIAGFTVNDSVCPLAAQGIGGDLRFALRTAGVFAQSANTEAPQSPVFAQQKCAQRFHKE
jgi:hypothetical protein